MKTGFVGEGQVNINVRAHLL